VGFSSNERDFSEPQHEETLQMTFYERLGGIFASQTLNGISQ
jgi:hypothetical protein